MDSENLRSSSISLTENGEMKVKADVSRDLKKSLSNLTGRDDVNELRSHIKQSSRSRIRTQSTFSDEVFSVPKPVVKYWARSIGLTSVQSLYSNLDLARGKYEGGFKVWESTRDLIKFIIEDQIVIGNLLQSSHTLKVLELGAGAALPSLALLNRLLEDPVFESEYRFHLQDYNWQVLASLTLINFYLNLPDDFFEALVRTKCLRLYFGSWDNFKRQSNYKYSLIIMSEVIYNADSYEGLHNLLSCHLKREGYVVIATKDTYFGLSGGLYSWLEYLRMKDVFKVFKIIRVSTTNIPRSILILNRQSDWSCEQVR